mgnify:FL=1
MKQFDLLGYIRKFQIPIVIVSILAGIIGFLILDRMQTYTASAIIRYSNASAEEGIAPDGTPIDTTEIYSSKVISQVFSRMGLDYVNYNIDDFRSRVAVTPVMTEKEQAMEMAALNSGTELESEQPTEYQVTFTAVRGDSGDLEVFARQFLDEMLDVYIASYGESHINYDSPAINDVSNLGSQSYDYLEQAEILRNSISNACDALDGRINADTEAFRSTTTGYSFSDLRREFALLRDVEISNLYAWILGNRVTENHDVLVAKYENRIKDYGLENDESQENIAAIQEIINTYVTMMRESGNTNITYEYILDELHDDLFTTEPEGEGEPQKVFDQTVEYDTLLSGFISENTDYASALVDIAYCQYILDVYNGLVQDNSNVMVQTPEEIQVVETTEGAPAEETAAAVESQAAGIEETEVVAAETVTAPQPIIYESSPELQAEAQQRIDTLTEKLNGLYEILRETNNEFNEYMGAANINIIAGIAVSPLIKIGRYVALITVFFGLVACVGAVVAGRLKDIFDYYVYVDRKTGLPNRMACDLYIAHYSKKLLKGDFTCITIRAEKIGEKNRVYGRDVTDQMLRTFGHILQEIFQHEDEVFLGVNGIGQFVIFAPHMTYLRAKSYLKQLKKSIAEYNAAESCSIEYAFGIADSTTTGIYQIRELLIKALSQEKENLNDSLPEGEPDFRSLERSKVITQLDELKKALHG